MARDPDSEQAAERGIRFATNLGVYVPCRVLHRAAMTLHDFDRVLAGFTVWPPPDVDDE